MADRRDCGAVSFGGYEVEATGAVRGPIRVLSGVK
jgi:hypothetical protein